MPAIVTLALSRGSGNPAETNGRPLLATGMDNRARSQHLYHPPRDNRDVLKSYRLPVLAEHVLRSASMLQTLLRRRRSSGNE